MTTQKTPISKKMPKHFANKKYKMACDEPYLWLAKSQETRRAADILWNQFVSEIQASFDEICDIKPEIGSVAMMLYGLTIENLLKAGLVVKGVGVKPNGNFGLKSHELLSLSKELGLSFSPDEREFVERLQIFVEWAGRYPIPLYKEGLYPRELQNGGGGALYGVSTGDGKRVIELLKKVESQLPSIEEAVESYVQNYKS